MQTIKAKGVELPVMSMVNNYDGKDWKVPRNGGDAGASGFSRAASQKRSQHSPLPNTIPASSSISRKFRRTSQENFQHFIHDLALSLHAASFEIDGCPSRRRLELRLQIFRLAGRCNYPDELRLSLARPLLPAPVVSQDWFVRNIDNILKLVPPQKIVMGIANYGYDWPAKIED